MRVLVACEFSGVVREAFRLRGHDAWSCDLGRAGASVSEHDRALEWVEDNPWQPDDTEYDPDRDDFYQATPAKHSTISEALDEHRVTNHAQEQHPGTDRQPIPD